MPRAKHTPEEQIAIYEAKIARIKRNLAGETSDPPDRDNDGKFLPGHQDPTAGIRGGRTKGAANRWPKEHKELARMLLSGQIMIRDNETGKMQPFGFLWLNALVRGITDPDPKISYLYAKLTYGMITKGFVEAPRGSHSQSIFNPAPRDPMHRGAGPPHILDEVPNLPHVAQHPPMVEAVDDGLGTG